MFAYSALASFNESKVRLNCLRFPVSGSIPASTTNRYRTFPFEFGGSFFIGSDRKLTLLEGVETAQEQRSRCASAKGVVGIRAAAGGAPSLPPRWVWGALPSVSATAPPPSTAKCGPAQWSRRSPVWPTGNLGLCCVRSEKRLSPTASLDADRSAPVCGFGMSGPPVYRTKSKRTGTVGRTGRRARIGGKTPHRITRRVAYRPRTSGVLYVDIRPERVPVFRGPFSSAMGEMPSRPDDTERIRPIGQHRPGRRSLSARHPPTRRRPRKSGARRPAWRSARSPMDRTTPR